MSNKTNLQVLGIDPGTHRLGWAIVTGKPNKQVAVKHGCLEFPRGTAPSVYLPRLYHFLSKLISQYTLDTIGLESLRFQKNVKTALSVAEVRGIIILVAGEHHLPVAELAPNTVKNCVVGHGGADKKDVKHMVGLLLGVDTAKLLDDETDALAVAITTITTHHKS